MWGVLVLLSGVLCFLMKEIAGFCYLFVIHDDRCCLGGLNGYGEDDFWLYVLVGKKKVVPLHSGKSYTTSSLRTPPGLDRSNGIRS